MRQNTFIFACLCSAAAIAVVNCVPVPASNQELDVLQIPLTDGKEIDVLTIGARDQEQVIAERNRRTVGLLRELFPDITKQIDSIVNRIIAQFIRVLGPSLLPTLLGNRPMTTATNTNTNDFDADFDDDDDDSSSNKDADDGFADIPATTASSNKNDTKINEIDGNQSGDTSTRVKIDLPTFAPAAVDDDDAAATIDTTTAKKR